MLLAFEVLPQCEVGCVATPLFAPYWRQDVAGRRDGDSGEPWGRSGSFIDGSHVLTKVNNTIQGAGQIGSNAAGFSTLVKFPERRKP
jgi:hypothetical protein